MDRGLGGEAVTALVEATASGFSGANTLSIAPTRSAIQAAESTLDHEQSGRITRILRALWEAHGGASSRFPAARQVGTLTDDDISYIISAAGKSTPEFWRSIGKMITTDQLGRLQVEDPSEGLQALIDANLEDLMAKGLNVSNEPLRLGEPELIPRWLITRGCLGLRGLNWTAYVAARRAEELPPATETPSPPLATMGTRSQNVAAITQVELGRGYRAITYESTDGGNVLGDPELHRISVDVNISTVDKAVAVLRGGGRINVDFARKTVTTPTNSTLPLGALLRAALPLLLDATSDEIQEVMTLVEGQNNQPDLFSTLETEQPDA